MIRFTTIKGKGINSCYSARLYLLFLCNQPCSFHRRRKIDQMIKLKTLDHTVLKMTAREGNMLENSFNSYKPWKACINETDA